ncbi:hypothetical protein [Polaribacter aquimarinus]|uniref:hypothetical protein n=1 Tax=Polaribacter aquimarinus TaxID=2100726 RepID=UPI0015E81AE0|nr:hypothetical protein [Polaribacter aquimarinus]
MSKRNIKFQRKFSSTRVKQAKPKKGLFLVLLLAIALILWFKAEAIMDYFF